MVCLGSPSESDVSDGGCFGLPPLVRRSTARGLPRLFVRVQDCPGPECTVLVSGARGGFVEGWMAQGRGWVRVHVTCPS